MERSVNLIYSNYEQSSTTVLQKGSERIAVLNLCKWFEEILDEILTWSSENPDLMPKNNAYAIYNRDMFSEKSLQKNYTFMELTKRNN